MSSLVPSFLRCSSPFNGASVSMLTNWTQSVHFCLTKTMSGIMMLQLLTLISSLCHPFAKAFNLHLHQYHKVAASKRFCSFILLWTSYCFFRFTDLLYIYRSQSLLYILYVIIISQTCLLETWFLFLVIIQTIRRIYYNDNGFIGS